MGEFARCSAIASAVLERWPRAAVHFVLSRHAPYVSRIPFPVTLLPSSATFHPAAVIELMRAWLPNVVIFDNAGRSAQLKAAHRLGAHVVFISSRRRQRRRAFRLSWMRLIDEHWIAYPRLIAGGFGLLEQAKLKLLRRPVVRYLDVIMARGAKGREATASAAGSAAAAASGVVVIPGGGTGHPGAADATLQFLGAARDLATAGFATTFVGPLAGSGVAPGAGAAASSPALRCVDALPQSDLAALMRGARLIIANGGSTLLQAIACGAPCVAAPIARDQRERIRRCAAAGSRDRGGPGRRGPRKRKRARCSRMSRRAPRSRAARRNSSLRMASRSLSARSRISCRGAERRRMPNIVLLGYDPDQPSFRHRMRSLVRPLECAGWAVRTERFPSGRYGLRTWERRALFRWADVVVLHQIKLSALEARLFAALSRQASVRRGRCHLRPQAAPAWRAGRRFALAAQEVCRDLPRGGCGGGRQRGARGRRARRGARRSRYCRPRSISRRISRARRASTAP